AVLDVEELDPAAVGRDRRVDRGVDQILNLALQIYAHDQLLPFRLILYPTSREGPTGPRWAPLSRTTVRRAGAGAAGRGRAEPPPRAAAARPPSPGPAP